MVHASSIIIAINCKIPISIAIFFEIPIVVAISHASSTISAEYTELKNGNTKFTQGQNHQSQTQPVH